MKLTFGTLLTLILALVLIGLGARVTYWYDRRPAGVPAPVRLSFLFFHKSLGLPLSLRAQRDVAVAELQAAVRKAQARNQALEQANAAISSRADAAERKAQDVIRYRTRVLIKEVPNAITPATDRRFPMPVGLIRVHDAAALGCGDVSCVPLTPGQSDDSPSPVEGSRLGTVIAKNYGECAATAKRLTDLQAWVRKEHETSLQINERAE